MTAPAAGVGSGGLRAIPARHPLAILALLCLVLWLPGIVSLPALDRDESRFAQSSKQMLESGDFIDIRFGQVPRYKKPVGIYWLQAATTEVAGLGDRDEIWTYRIASLLGGIAAVWLAFWCARAFAPAETALIASALLASSLLLTAESTIATTDAVLLATAVAAQGVLIRVYLAARDAARAQPSRTLVLAGWAALGIGILVKGPVVPGVLALTAAGLALWDRDGRWLRSTRPLLGLVVVAVIVAPWAIAIELESHGAFYQQSLGTDFASKIAGGQESHGAPPGYYLALVTLTLWPATLLLIPAIGEAVRRRTEPVIRFLAIWAGANWIMFELVPTKLPHYVLPVYPALAMLGALWAETHASAAKPRNALTYAAAAQFLFGVAAFAAAPILLARMYGAGDTWWLAALSAAGAILGIAAAIALLRGRHGAACAAAIGAALVFYPTLTLGVAPGLDKLWVSERVAALARKDRLAQDPPPALAGFEEPSLVFGLGTDTRLTDGTGAADIAAEQGGLAVIEGHEQRRFLDHLRDRGAEAFAVGTVSGLNYSKGKEVHITIYRVSPAQFDKAPPAE